MRKLVLMLALAGGVAATGSLVRAQEEDGDAAPPKRETAALPGTRTLEIGVAGLMERSNRTDLDEITLTAGAMKSAGAYSLKSGGYYRIKVSSDGTQEQAIEAPGLFRNVWVNEVVINDIEVRPLGLDSIEFDDAGTTLISFVAITPGSYEMRIRGTSGDTQKATFVIE